MLSHDETMKFQKVFPWEGIKVTTAPSQSPEDLICDAKVGPFFWLAEARPDK